MSSIRKRRRKRRIVLCSVLEHIKAYKFHRYGERMAGRSKVIIKKKKTDAFGVVSRAGRNMIPGPGKLKRQFYKGRDFHSGSNVEGG